MQQSAGRSPTIPLYIGLVITLAAVVAYSAYVSKQITSLRQLQNNLIDRNRKDSLQLLRPDLSQPPRQDSSQLLRRDLSRLPPREPPQRERLRPEMFVAQREIAQAK